VSDLKNSRLLLRANLYSLASAAFQPAIDLDAVKHATWIIQLFHKELPVATVWSTRIALCKSTQTFINKCKAVPSIAIPEEELSLLWQSLKICAGDRGYESVRTAAAKAVADFVRLVEGRSEWAGLQSQTGVELPEIIAAETSTIIQAEYTG
jgi:hypothetical protein